MSTTRKPSQRPTARPPIKPAPKHARPMTDALMERITATIDSSAGKLTRRQLAADIGKSYSQVIEFLTGFRSAPNSETTLALVDWIAKHQKRGKKQPVA